MLLDLSLSEVILANSRLRKEVSLLEVETGSTRKASEIDTWSLSNGIELVMLKH